MIIDMTLYVSLKIGVGRRCLSTKFTDSAFNTHYSDVSMKLSRITVIILMSNESV